MTQLFKALIERARAEKEWLPKIHAQLDLLNENISSQAAAAKQSTAELTKIFKKLADNEAEFIETIRHFFAFSKETETQRLKRLAQAEDDLRPGKHDNIF